MLNTSNVCRIIKVGVLCYSVLYVIVQNVGKVDSYSIAYYAYMSVLCCWLFLLVDGTTAAVLQPELVVIVDNILRSDDTNNNGLIEYSEFVVAMRRNRQR